LKTQPFSDLHIQLQLLQVNFSLQQFATILRNLKVSQFVLEIKNSVTSANNFGLLVVQIELQHLL
jgi:hypothetical protein